MAVQYYNGQLYDVVAPSMANVSGAGWYGLQNNNYSRIPGISGLAKLIGGGSNTTQQPQSSANNGMFGNPFGTAMSGTKSGTLQPYVNRNSQMANQALYGGLLGYNPRAIMSGDAGGKPVNSTPPQFNMQGAIPQQGQGLNFTGFGNRSWMGK